MTDQLAGFVAVAITEAKVVLDNLWVRPDLIGKGVGRQACEHVFRLAREHGWTELWVVPDHPAIGFYEKMGFSVVGSALFYFGEQVGHDHVMARTLPA